MKSMKIKKIISAVMCMAMLSAMINAPTAWADGVTATIKDGGAVIATLSESELKDYLPEKDGYKFIGLCDEGGAVIDTSKELTATATFYAMWLENPKFSASADGTKLVSTKITSDIQSPEAEVITAFYKNDELVKASVNQNTASYSDTDRAKVMVWNSLKSMKPLMGAIDGSFDALALTDPVKDVNGKVHNYSENQFNYLNDSAASFDEALISNYAKGNALIEQAPVTIAWNSSENVTGYTLKLADNAELENAEEIGLENDVTSYDLYDLYTGTDYYWQVTAKLESGAEVSKASTFTTENIGPRVVSIEGLQNTRDIGGYASSLTDSEGNPLRTKQGMVYRGGEISGSGSYGAITEAGKEKLLNELGVKTDLDLRSPGEEFVRKDVSPANTENYFIDAVRGGYGQAFSGIGRVCYASAFRRFADADNYPIYVHCQGGADRTGTVIFLINALCGISYEDLVRDFEFTSFAKYGMRTRTEENRFTLLKNRIMSSSYGDDTSTLAERAEAYMKAIGITDTEIANIRANMLGNADPTSEILTKTHVYDGNDKVTPISYKLEPYTNDGTTPFTFKITNSKDMTVKSVTVNEKSVSFTINANYSISVPAAEMPSEDGSYSANVTFTNGESFDFTVAVSNYEIVDISETGFVEAGESRTITEATSATIALGYNKGVRMKLSNDTGGLGIKIGNYGMRIYENHIIRAHGGQQLYYIPSTYFNNTEHIVELWLTFDEEYVYNHINTYYTNGNLQFSYTIPTPKSAVTTVDSADAKVSFQLYSGATEVTVKSLVQVPTSAVGLSEFNYFGDDDYQIKLKGFDGLEVSKLTINGTETEYTLDGTIMTVAKENMPKLDSNTYQGVVTTTDGQELAFNVIYDNVLDISDTGFMQQGESKTVSSVTTKSAKTLGSVSVGYNNTVRFAMKIDDTYTSDTYSNLGLTIGSYGFYSRGNNMRSLCYNGSAFTFGLSSTGVGQLKDFYMYGYTSSSVYEGSLIFEMKVDTLSTAGSAIVYLTIYKADGTKLWGPYSQTYIISDTDISSDNAKLILTCSGDSGGYSSVTFGSLKNPAVDITPTTEFNRYGDSDYTVTLGDLNGLTVKSLTVNGAEVDYSLNDDNTLLTVARENMPELANGTYTAVMKFTNLETLNDSSVKFNITYENILDVADLGFTLADDGSFTLTAPNTTTNATTFANGTTNVGYNTKVTFDLQNTRTTTVTTDSETGETTSTVTAKYMDGLFLGIGSYGINLLTGFLRPVSKSSGTNFSINWSGTGPHIGNNRFVAAARKVVMWVTLESDTTAYVNIQIDGTPSTYKVPVTRKSSENEIASENAKFTVGLMNDSVQSVTLK